MILMECESGDWGWVGDRSVGDIAQEIEQKGKKPTR
jgi:hypothetical protein